MLFEALRIFVDIAIHEAIHHRGMRVYINEKIKLVILEIPPIESLLFSRASAKEDLLDWR